MKKKIAPLLVIPLLALLVIANYNLHTELAQEKEYTSILQEHMSILSNAHYEVASRLAALESPPEPQIPSNNPGNIVKGVSWQGEVSCNGRFECFKSPEHGIRAMGKLIHTYKTRHGLTTVEAIINRWAPPHENDTKSFVKFVKRAVRGDVNNTHNLIKAIITFEQGRQPYSDETIARGLTLV